MNLTRVKSVFFKTLIGCLVAAAGLAVVTVLIGSFNDVCQKALFTILLVALHALVGISFITNNEKQDTFDSLSFFTTSTFVIIILSFMTSLFGTWSILPGDLVARLYALYFVLLFAVLHGEVLAKTLNKQSHIDRVVYTNFVFMLIVVVMLLPVIFVSDTALLSSLYYRLLAACGIIDATLTLIAVILHHLYIQKHPQVVDPVFSIQQVAGQNVPVMVQQQPPKRHMNIFVVLLLAYITLQVIGGIILVIVGSLST